MKRAAGQSSLEVVLTASAILIVLVAMSLYVRYASAGRLKAIGSGLSDVLFDSNHSNTTWTVPSQVSVESTQIVGGRAATANDPGTAGVPLRKTETFIGGSTTRTDQL